MNQTLTQTALPFPKRQGKVRDCYDLGDSLLIVSTDRISAFDYILPNGIPDKGKVLTQLSKYWFSELGVTNHLISTAVPEIVKPHDPDGLLVGRVMQVRKASVIPFECVIRGYLEGSGWKDYQATQSICGIKLPAGLKQCDKIDAPIFTPTTKADAGHDQNVSFEEMARSIGGELAAQLRDQSITVYQRGAEIAASRGIIIADTKFEWGMCDGQVILIDEVLTPDSSRFWPRDSYQAGRAQQSFDKQFVREYLMSTSWDRNSPPPQLPVDIIERTRSKYVEAFEKLTGKVFVA